MLETFSFIGQGSWSTDAVACVPPESPVDPTVRLSTPDPVEEREEVDEVDDALEPPPLPDDPTAGSRELAFDVVGWLN